MLCLECGKEVRSINYWHLQACSGMTQREYRARHPGAELMENLVKQSCGMKLEQNPNWKGGKTYRRCEKCGKRLARHTKGKHCAKCRDRTGKKNSFFGKRHTVAARQKMVASNKQRDVVTYKGGVRNPEVSRQIQKRYWARLSSEEKAERLKSFIVAGQKYNKKSSQTRIENSLAGLLNDLNHRFERNTQIGRYNVDFLVNKQLVIECFGDYWHCNPHLFQAGDYNKSLKMTARDKWAKDAKRKTALESKGYTFIAFWESDIQKTIERVKQDICECLTMNNDNQIN
jgi:very-short-patch-repair endonuclease